MSTEIARVDEGWPETAGLGVADWICLAATPTFAVMALLTTMLGGSPTMICASGSESWPLDGMVWMYILMSAFHTAPWLKLIASRRGAASRR